MNIALFGTPQLSADIFEHIFSLKNIRIHSVITPPDKPSGRGRILSPPPVKIWAEQKKIPVFQPKKPDISLAKYLKEHTEVLIVISYRCIFSRQFLSSAPPAWNLHFSLLPKFRGASPVPSAILAGERISGVTVFRITPGMDSGPILLQKKIHIFNKYAEDIFRDMSFAGGEILSSLLNEKQNNQELEGTPQKELSATYCKKIMKKDGYIDPKKDTAAHSFQKLLAYSPWPGIYTDFFGKRLKILSANIADIHLTPGEFSVRENKLFLGCSKKSLELLKVQTEGKRSTTGEEFVRGQKKYF
jgi:methionyl-tRNA formyltransferase